jgi:phosphoribosylanthranilate isomerase
MSLITKIKAGSVSSLSDARFFAGMGVDWLGFDVNPQSENYVRVELYKDIAGWVTGPKRVIELNDKSLDDAVEKLVSNYLPDFIQVNLHQVKELSSTVPVFAYVHTDALDINFLKSMAQKIEYLVVDLGSTHPLNQSRLLSQIASQVKVLLSVSPQIADIKKIIAELPISGLAFKGSKELKAGIKEYDYSALLESLDDDA